MRLPVARPATRKDITKPRREGLQLARLVVNGGRNERLTDSQGGASFFTS